ncbi:MAG: pyrroline-5-carboxylate reductase, partial [Lachnospiraceae bacterium]|nr:pyrroline-5-carboxylate reductase [Lachnospiraceae bacterium]
IGFIGLGNMAKAMIGGILGEHIVSEGSILGYDSLPLARNQAAETYGIGIGSNNIDVAHKSDVLILAVKPQVIEEVIKEIAEHVGEEKLVISIAPGKSLELLQERFKTGSGRKVRIVRCMPNTPALVGEGMTGYCVNEYVTDEDKSTAVSILSSFGKAEEVPEKLIPAVTSVSGSSPAYVFILIEAMADQAVSDGMNRVQAYKFAAQAVLGSAKMVLETGKHPGELKDMVCSPAGTTIEAVKILEREGFRAAIEDAMEACTEKAR